MDVLPRIFPFQLAPDKKDKLVSMSLLTCTSTLFVGLLAKQNCSIAAPIKSFDEQAKARGGQTCSLGVSAKKYSFAPELMILTSCETCRKQKEKCEGGPPCWRCQRLGRPCHFQGQPTLTETPSISIPITPPSGDKNRIEKLEYIARHFLGDLSLEDANLTQIVNRLQNSRTESARTEAALDINESFDVHFVSKDIAHYSGEFSHWNFSKKLRRKMSGQVDPLATQVSALQSGVSGFSDTRQLAIR